VEGSDGKNCHTPAPATTELPVLTWPEPARWGSLRCEGREGQEAPTRRAVVFGLHAVLLVRSDIDPQNTVPIVRNAVHALDPTQPIYQPQTVDALRSDTLARQQMTAILLGIFSIVALALAGIGIYGVLSYSVAQRTREIGVRMAVGANRTDVLRLVLSQAGRFAAIGIVVGLAAGLACARLISGLLFNTSPVDPLSVWIAIGALVLAAALAVIIPAGRAASVNPDEALRAE
jgi:predicted lysophospholipase L1 biosynthesis ABC-type transport system permease subunit